MASEIENIFGRDYQQTDEMDVERQKIKERLSKMSFEELLKLKGKIGTKMYNRTVSGAKATKKPRNDFKRANKNRPREMSSKKRITSRFENIISLKKTALRDPRFESMCGTFNKDVFKENYKFVNDLRKKEKQKLESELRDTSDPDEKKKISLLLQRLSNQIREETLRERKNQEKTANINEMKNKMEKGEKPHFKKKSVQKLESLINKFEDLKKANKIHKHIERKSKKLSIKEHQKCKNQKFLSY